MSSSCSFSKMHFTFYLTIMVLSLWVGLSQAGRNSLSFKPSIKIISRTITVDPAGHGDCTKVQQAIDSVPPNNKEWVRIVLKKNTYTEKVVVPIDKPFILLDGEGRDNTIIVWNDPGSGFQDATFAVLGGGFVARNIQFKNSYNQPMPEDGNLDNGPLTWTTAAFVGGDRVSFYNCSFYGQQDTLNDAKGRHYFKSCYIEGLVDFIWGNGQSIYQDCQIFINTKPRPRSSGYITAQGRESENDTTGFVFISGSVLGNGNAFLGRAYRQYSRVLFYNTRFDNVIPPEGWGAWNFVGNEKPITFAEEGCTGPGANTSKRVKWEKKLSPQELDMLTDPATFINQDGWLRSQPWTM